MNDGSRTDPMSAMETDDELKRAARTTSILIIVSGVSALIFGILILVWPQTTLLVVAVLFGLQLLIAGIVRIVSGAIDSSAADRTARDRIRRLIAVLKPECELHFLEHGPPPTESVRRWQRRVHPLHSRIAGDCHLDRPIDDLITDAGLIIAELETGYGQGPRPFSYLYQGRALRVA